ncbi:uncharacterized protein LOC141712314 [Apium graveolens]|uniref:uncharacterized protein LOC141712314 n=1 Tax=Apium graveolens TaxID=4045 RepID=UPI003D7B8284
MSGGVLSDRERVNQVTENENADLIAAVTDIEVKEAIFSMHPEKSPGPDGSFQKSSNRLKPCLGKLIFDKQSAFVEGRLLTDNALIAFEDRVMNLVTSVFYSFVHNASVFGDVVPQRGVRQGDPISPYLYILCAEGLSSIIRRNEDARLLYGCVIARGVPAISHLLFADDCYFFFRANKPEANVMKRILDCYEDVSGQVINRLKSTIIFSPNTSDMDKEEVCEQLGVNVIQTPGTNLGMPRCIGRRKVATFSFLTERVQQKNPRVAASTYLESW